MVRVSGEEAGEEAGVEAGLEVLGALGAVAVALAHGEAVGAGALAPGCGLAADEAEVEGAP
jgi:hypothetical protein